MSDSPAGKTILITGANRGIGLALAQRLQALGAEVIAVCRRSSSDLDALGVEVIDGVDVSDQQQVEGLARKLEGRNIDWLVNNAGILERDTLEPLDVAAIERQFRVNTLGPLMVSAALLDRFAAGSKVFVITSAMGSIGDNTSGGYYGYRISKAAVNMAFKSLSVDLAPRKVGAYMLHPGFVSTDMVNNQGEIAPETSAAGLVERMIELRIEDSGTFRHARGHNLEW